MFNNPIRYTDPSGHKPCIDTDSNGQCVVDPTWHSNNMFSNLPIKSDDLKGVQWFGGSKRAYDLWKWGSDIYAYCHYAHCGLDLLADYGTPVYAGVYGQVISISSIDMNNPAGYEGPWKIQIKVGDYVITYGHTDGTAFVSVGQWVTPNTLISGVGNMGGYEGSGEIDHIHLEVRGPEPAGWAGPSQNPLQFMSVADRNVLANVAEHQSLEVEMGQFTDGQEIYSYPPPPGIMPSTIIRTDQFGPPFYVK